MVRNTKTVSTGIYTQTTEKIKLRFDDNGLVDDEDRDDHKAFFDILPEAFGVGISFHTIMDGLEASATEILAAPAEKPHEIERRREAEKLLRDTHGLRQYLTDTAKPERVGYFAFYLGVLAERIGVREFEPHAERGIKVLDGAKSAGAETNRKNQKKRPAFQADVDAILATNPPFGITEARRRVAKKHGVSFETVKNHTKKANARKVEE
jgi:hypothetical protein